MHLTTQILERLSRQAANEAELLYEAVSVECDLDFLWEITFFGQSSAVAVLVDAHVFNTEVLFGEEIKTHIRAKLDCSNGTLWLQTSV
jgi:hypothetical protein